MHCPYARVYWPYAVLVTGIILLAVTTSSVVTWAQPPQGSRPPSPVEVVNEGTRPVPVDVLSGITLEGGQVRAEQAGDWSVFIANGQGTPIPVIQARQPVQFDVTVPLDELLQSVEDAFVVPEGKRLVIEYVSTEGSTGLINLPENAAYQAVIITRVRGVQSSRTHRLSIATPVQGGIGPAVRVWGSSEMVRIYASGGTTVRMGAKRAFDPEGALFDVSIVASGYLEDDL